MSPKITASLYALGAAVFYALNVPASKLLMDHVPATFMAALLYLGAGIGISLMALFRLNGREGSKPLTNRDMPFVVGMIVLDVAAPIFLMTGINLGTSSNASLLGNFEIAATTVIAVLAFGEKVSRRLWLAIILITLSGIILTFEGADSLKFSYGSLFVLMAASCWGLENNCTRMIASKSTYQIVILKGIFSGAVSMVIALMIGESVPGLPYALSAMLLGFVAYGLSIFFYVRAQNIIGAAKTSAYYAAAPFIGVILSFVLLDEKISGTYILALSVMIVGTVLVVMDTLILSHTHKHAHIITHTHGGTKHTHIIIHTHPHNHYAGSSRHIHAHS